MLTIHPLRNQIQAYSWGSRSALAELLGRPVPAEEPQAELWMGAHPRAPSSIRVEGTWRSLADVVAERPEELLGRRVVERHGRELPFLFKVLAAERALSIQAHPDREQAAMGCRREDALRVPRDAARRNYRDDWLRWATPSICRLDSASPFPRLTQKPAKFNRPLRAQSVWKKSSSRMALSTCLPEPSRLINSAIATAPRMFGKRATKRK